jgi:hypothetical protein
MVKLGLTVNFEASTDYIARPSLNKKKKKKKRERERETWAWFKTSCQEIRKSSIKTLEYDFIQELCDALF